MTSESVTAKPLLMVAPDGNDVTANGNRPRDRRTEILAMRRTSGGVATNQQGVDDMTHKARIPTLHQRAAARGAYPSPPVELRLSLDGDPVPKPGCVVAERARLRREFWRLAPTWVPRSGYAAPTGLVLRDVEAALRRFL